MFVFRKPLVLHSESDPDLGDGGGGGGEWIESLPESVREWDEVKNSDSPDAFFKQVSDMRSHLGNSIRFPGEDAGPEDMKLFHDKLQKHVPGLMPTPNLDDKDATETIFRAFGKPETADGYKVPDLETAGVPIDEGRVKDMLPVFHELNLTQAQAEGLIKAATERDVNSILQANKAREEDQAKLSEEWGVRFDQRRDVVLSLATKTEAPPSLIEAIQKGTADASTLKWLFNLTKQLSVEGQEIINQHQSSGGVGPEEAREKISEIMNNREHPYWVSSHPQHDAAVKRMVELRKIAPSS